MGLGGIQHQVLAAGSRQKHLELGLAPTDSLFSQLGYKPFFFFLKEFQPLLTQPLASRNTENLEVDVVKVQA